MGIALDLNELERWLRGACEVVVLHHLYPAYQMTGRGAVFLTRCDET